jgi:phospholipase/lecithinase/hemolysin
MEAVGMTVQAISAASGLSNALASWSACFTRGPSRRIDRAGRNRMRATVVALFALAFAGIAPRAPHAASAYDAIYAFGDSLSDTGNVLFATTHGLAPPGTPAQPVPPYVNGQFSNGAVWLQTLASYAGVPALTPSLLGGTDYAFGGAQTGTTPFHTADASDLTGTTGQLAQFAASHASADPNALYTVWIGANDLGNIPSGASAPAAAAAIAASVLNIDSAIGALAGQGAKNFLVVTVPDLGKTPDGLALGPAGAAAASILSATFNSVLVDGIGPIPSLAAIAAANGLDISELDTYGLLNQAVVDPAAFGLTNVTARCFTGTYDGGPSSGTVCGATTAEQDQYLYWDGEHPTAGVHAIIGTEAAAALGLSTPEPSSLVLIASMLGLLAATRWVTHRERSAIRTSTGCS